MFLQVALLRMMPSEIVFVSVHNNEPECLGSGQPCQDLAFAFAAF